jgi:replicative DNA helicase
MNTIRTRAEEISQQVSGHLNNTQRALEMQNDVLHTLSTMIRMISESPMYNDEHFIEITTEILRAVSRLQQDLPRQVMMQKPIYLEDARGVTAPFYLEFITSKEVWSNRY